MYDTIFSKNPNDQLRRISLSQLKDDGAVSSSSSAAAVVLPRLSGTTRKRTDDVYASNRCEYHRHTDDSCWDQRLRDHDTETCKLAPQCIVQGWGGSGWWINKEETNKLRAANKLPAKSEAELVALRRELLRSHQTRDGGHGFGGGGRDHRFGDGGVRGDGLGGGGRGFIMVISVNPSVQQSVPNSLSAF